MCSIKNFETTYKAYKIEITVEDAQGFVYNILAKDKFANTIINVLAPVKTFTFTNWKEVKITKLPEPRTY